MATINYNYRMTFISNHGSLCLRFFKDGKVYKTKNLNIPATTEDIMTPETALDGLMAGYRQRYTQALWQIENGLHKDVYDIMFPEQESSTTVHNWFKGTNFLLFAGDIDWSDITNALLYDYNDYLENEDYSDNTIKKYLNEVKIRLDRARDCKIVFPAEVYTKILKGKKGTTTSVYLTKSEVMKFAQVRVDNEQEEAVKTRFLLSCFTGCRWSDVVGLNLSNITYSEYENVDGTRESIREISYVSQKTSTDTRVPMKPIVEDLLRNMGEDVSNAQANYILPRLCQRAGITGKVKVVKADKLQEGEKWEFVRTHTARKSFATNVYLSGEYDIRSISKMMGHATSTTTEQTYIICGYFRRTGVIVSYFD